MSPRINRSKSLCIDYIHDISIIIDENESYSMDNDVEDINNPQTHENTPMPHLELNLNTLTAHFFPILTSNTNDVYTILSDIRATYIHRVIISHLNITSIKNTFASS